jgi:hypothetical protein
MQRNLTLRLWLIIHRCCAIVAAVAALASFAHAAERVTLRNGFDIDCDHHASVDGKIRLYYSRGEDNYVDRLPEDIVSFETVPDPPAPPEPKSPESSQTSPKTKAYKKLTQADLGEILNNASHDYHVDVDLLASLVKAESNGDARAVSRAGAQGLMQLMPGTARDMGVQDSFKPEQNVRGGAIYLDALLTRYHDNMALALAAYNAGPAAVDKYNGIPPYRETRAYVARVIHEFNRRVLAREAEAKRLAELKTHGDAAR